MVAAIEVYARRGQPLVWLPPRGVRLTPEEVIEQCT
jgi:hypothetical protein